VSTSGSVEVILLPSGVIKNNILRPPYPRKSDAILDRSVFYAIGNPSGSSINTRSGSCFVITLDTMDLFTVLSVK
jgi:hypothetical protein